MKNIFFLLIFSFLVGSSLDAAPEKPHHKKKSYSTKVYKKKHRLGLKRDVRKHWRMKHRARKLRGAALGVSIPASVDLSPLISPPESQGSCGSCWAFGITKGLRSALMLKDKDPGVLAFNYLLNNCGGVRNESGCNGGDFDAGENMLGGKGPWLEVRDPYLERQGRCKNLSPVATANDWVLVGSENRAPTFKELATALSERHPLVVDVAVCGQWSSYLDGIYDFNQCGARSINHIVNMNGYVCEKPDAAGNCVFNASGQPVGGGYLIVMNNWGTQWGENGYMRTRYGVDAIATTAMFFEVPGEDPKPPEPPKPPDPVPPAPPVPGPIVGTSPWLVVLITALGTATVVFGTVAIVAIRKKTMAKRKKSV